MTIDTLIPNYRHFETLARENASKFVIFQRVFFPIYSIYSIVCRRLLDSGGEHG